MTNLPIIAREDGTMLNPRTGEIVAREDVAGLGDIIDYLREVKRTLNNAIAALTDEIVLQSKRSGMKTFHTDVGKVTVVEKAEIQWDIPLLRELLELGLPEERFNQLVKEEVSYRVDQRVAKSIAASNEEYAEIIEEARSEYRKPPFVKVER